MVDKFPRLKDPAVFKPLLAKESSPGSLPELAPSVRGFRDGYRKLVEARKLKVASVLLVASGEPKL